MKTSAKGKIVLLLVKRGDNTIYVRVKAGGLNARADAFPMSPKRLLKFALIGVGALILFAVPPTLWLFFSYYHQLENEVVTRFSGKRWNIPSRIYSDSILIYPGQNLKDLGFFERLARLNYHPVDAGKVDQRGEYSYRPQARQARHLPAQLRVSVRQLRRRIRRAESQGRCDRLDERSGDAQTDLSRSSSSRN